jgi:hypothetical protein
MDIKFYIVLLGTWFLFMILAIMNAGLRNNVYKAIVGELIAHQISTVILIIIILLMTYIIIRFSSLKLTDNEALLMGFLWFIFPIAFVLGDLTDKGTVNQYEQLVDAFTVLTKHNREDFYLLPGNHDIGGGISRYRNYVDQFGINSRYSKMDNNKRKYYFENISDDMDGYSISVGNTLFIMMAPSWESEKN